MRLLPSRRAEFNSPLSAAEVRKRISTLIEERPRSSPFQPPDSPFEDLTEKSDFKPFFGTLGAAGFRLLLRAPGARWGGRRAVSVVVVGEVHANENKTRIAARVGLSAGTWLFIMFALALLGSFVSAFWHGGATEDGREWATVRDCALVGTLYWVLVLVAFGANARRALRILAEKLECTDQGRPAP